MSDLQVRDAQPGEYAAMLELNNAAVPAVNAHDAQSWEQLLAAADRTWVVVDDAGTLAGQLVTFAPQATYGSANYAWLSERFDNFRYVDRIVASPDFQRRGVASRLYGALAAHATEHGAPVLLCEVNVEPPNPVSMAFHEANGWVAIEDREHSPGAVVRYFRRDL